MFLLWCCLSLVSHLALIYCAKVAVRYSAFIVLAPILLFQKFVWFKYTLSQAGGSGASPSARDYVESDPSQVRCHVQDMGTGHYQVQFRPFRVGPHVLKVRHMVSLKIHLL